MGSLALGVACPAIETVRRPATDLVSASVLRVAERVAVRRTRRAHQLGA